MSVPIVVGPEVMSAYTELKMKRKHRWLIMRIDNESDVVLEAMGEPSSPFAEFVDKMPKNEPR